MQDTPRSVREVTDRIRDLFDSDPVLSDIWITGEVLEATLSRSGHVFFTLVGEGSQLRCVIFRMNVLRQRSLPSPGSACVAHGKIESYSSEGTYQFYVDLVEEAGIGLAALELELLRQQLEAEGLFAEDRKRSLPDSPSVIGVVTSSSGAVWHDIQNVVRRRHPLAKLLLAPAAVQGEGAAVDLIAALQSFAQVETPDVIIIARGGGSVADLAPFNDENLVRAVFAAPVPVVSAIGHETDWTLLDLVADVRAPTPSAAAELVTPFTASRLQALSDAIALNIMRYQRDIQNRYLDVERMRVRLEKDELSSRTSRLEELWQAAIENCHRRQFGADERAARGAALLDALSPAKTMTRGYAFVELADNGRPVRSASEAAPGSTLRTRFIDGSVESRVTASTS